MVEVAANLEGPEEVVEAGFERRVEEMVSLALAVR